MSLPCTLAAKCRADIIKLRKLSARANSSRLCFMEANMQTITKKLDELKHPDKNLRLHVDKQIKEYIRSIEMFGQIRPLVIDEKNVVLAGNGLLTALKSMGRKTADCYVVSELTSKQKKKLMLADNKIFELGVNDADAFNEILRELGDDIDIPGYDADLLKTLTASFDGIQKFSPEQANENYGNFEDVAHKKKTITCPHCGREIEL